MAECMNKNSMCSKNLQSIHQSQPTTLNLNQSQPLCYCSRAVWQEQLCFKIQVSLDHLRAQLVTWTNKGWESKEWWLQKVWKQKGNDFFHGWKNQCWRGIRSSLVIAKESSPQHEVIVTTEAWHVIGMACCILKLTGKTWQVPARSNDQIIAFDPDLMAKTAKWLGKQFVASVAKRGCRKVYDLLSTFHEDWTDGTENSPVFEARPKTQLSVLQVQSWRSSELKHLGFLCDGFWVCPKVGVPTSHWFVGRASWWPVNFRRIHARWIDGWYPEQRWYCLTWLENPAIKGSMY